MFPSASAFELVPDDVAFTPKLTVAQRVPRDILWPGFLLNTLLDAVAAWLVLFAGGTIRRARRRKRNQCEACVYPCGPNAVCTECGHPLAPAA